ncbi:sigma-70 family RNA polymerase sigma factor SigK [Gordonia sinesedis]
MTAGDRGTAGRASARSGDASQLQDLLAACARGDRGAFAQLYDLTSARIYGLALRVIRDSGYAEEIVQESYLQYWQKAADYHPGRGSVITWMMTIAHRRAVDRVRTEELHRRRSVEYGASNASVPHAIPLEVVVDREDHHALRRCMDRLTDLQRRTIEMSYFNGLTYPQVAEQTATPLPTIKSRIRDGLRSLRSCLGGRTDG